MGLFIEKPKQGRLVSSRLVSYCCSKTPYLNRAARAGAIVAPTRRSRHHHRATASVARAPSSPPDPQLLKGSATSSPAAAPPRRLGLARGKSEREWLTRGVKSPRSAIRKTKSATSASRHRAPRRLVRVALLTERAGSAPRARKTAAKGLTRPLKRNRRRRRRRPHCRIVRPAAAAPTRPVEPVEQHRAAQVSRARVGAAKMVNAVAPSPIVETGWLSRATP